MILGKKIGFLFCVFLCSQILYAQNSDNLDFSASIATDRPDQTETPSLTPAGWFQAEAGLQNELDEEEGIKTGAILNPTVLWKYGLSKRFELRLITELRTDITGAGKSSLQMTGMGPVTIGSKIAVCEQSGIIPQISLISHLTLPWFGSSDFKPFTIIPRYRFLFSHNLSRRVNFSYNLGMEWEDGSSISTSIYTITFAFLLNDKLGIFIEGYGFLREKTLPDHRFDGGFTYLLDSNNQIDISAGCGLSTTSADYLISCGYSFRFDAKHFFQLL